VCIVVTNLIWPFQNKLNTGAIKAKAELTEAETELANTKKALADATQDIEELFDPKFFGAEGEWRKLVNQCISKDTGE
jgi:protein kinase C substrate 80K-H